METEDQILKGTKLVTNIKKQRLKSRIKVRLSKIQYKKYKAKSITKNFKNVYMKVALKIGSFFLQGNSRL